MIVTHKIKMDLTQRGVIPDIDVVQDDQYSRNIQLALWTDRVPYYVPENSAVLIRYAKPDGTGGEYDTMPDGTQAWTIEENLVTVRLAPQVCTAPGDVDLTVTLILGDAELSCFALKLCVQELKHRKMQSRSYQRVKGFLPQPSVAEVGQYMRVAAVTRDGKVAVTEAVDLPIYQSDWEQNDALAPEYIRNRTHYAGTVVVGPTFDGDLSGRNYVGMDGTYLVKVSDQIPTVEELTGATVAGNMGGTDSTLTLTADMIQDASAEGFPAIICVYQEIPMVWCAKENLTISEGVDLTPGTWFIYALGQFYVKSLSCLEDNDYTKDILKQLDEKFIPDTIARKTEIPQIPTALPNPNALTIDGVVYDGSAPVTIAIPNADLAQNDPAQKDYVSGRTHWTDDDGTIHKLDNKYIDAEWMATKSLAKVKGEILFPETAHEVMLKFGATGSEIFAPGTTIVVTVNGADYMCDALEMSDGNVFFGNAHTAENDGLGEFAGKTMEDTGEPFYMYGTAEYGYLFTDAVGAYTTSVSAAVEAEIPNKLPEEFLPEGYSKDELVAAVIAALPNAEEVAF